MNINIKVRVSLEAAPSLTQLVEIVADALRPTIDAQGAVGRVKAYVRQTQENGETVKTEDMRTLIAPVPDYDDTPAAIDEPAPADEPAPTDEPAQVTDEALRAAINGCCERLLGADWNSADKVKERKALQKFIKGQAVSLAASYGLDGVTKPTELPEGPVRVAMVKTLGDIEIANGKPTVKPPF